MRERMVKILRCYILLAWIACIALACSFSGIDAKSIVHEPKPIPEFSIPEKIPGKKSPLDQGHRL